MRLILATTLIFNALFLVTGQTISERPVQNGVEQDLRRLENEWLSSYLRGDKQTFDRIVADDFTGTDESGKTRNKAQERELVQIQPDPTGVTLTNEDAQIRIYGETAIVTGRIVSKAQSGAQASINFQSRFTDTWLKRQGRWQVVARHYSRLPPQRTAVKLEPKIYDAYAGQYELAPGVVFNVTKENDKLMSQVTGQPKFELLPESEIGFFLREAPAQFVFHRDEKGQVARLLIIQDGRIIPLRKIK